MKSSRLLLCVAALACALTMSFAADLPLTRVQLFSSGVGYFEREGAVTGNTTVELSFRTEQVNDILKSLVLQDFGGGTIAPVTYGSQDPLQRTLGSFAVDLSDNPRLSALWDRLRGAKVRVVAADMAEGIAFGSEEQEKAVGESVVTFEVLNLLTDKGLRQFPIWQIKTVQILDPKLNADVHKALAALDQARDTDRKPVTLSFNGQGKRDVSLGYLLETPVWKTSYRLVADKDAVLLQGWALVENTTDDDWTAVNLSLISGRPVSFTQDLYQPLYVSRPAVPVQVATAARPRVHEGAMEQSGAADEESDAVARVAEVGRRGAGSGAPGAPQAAPMVAATMAKPAAPPAREMRLDRNSAAAMAEGGKVGTLFQYAVTQPVTIPRQRSAMIPIINSKVQGERVSVYNQYADARRPMNGILLKNTSPLHLMGGPVTVFAGNAYGGDALIEDIAPGDERLLTYAMDLAVEVEPQAKSQPDQLLTAKVVNGVLSLTYKSRMETTYNLKSVADEKRTVLVEHPLRADWKLLEPAKADERTRNAYRFRVPLEAGKSASLKVVEELSRLEEVVLGRGDMNSARLYVARPELSEKLRAALQKIVAMQDELTILTAQRAEKETRLKEIEQEQARIRANMKELDKANELYKQYVDKLTKQETEFETLRADVRALREKETAKRQQIAEYISGLNLE